MRRLICLLLGAVAFVAAGCTSTSAPAPDFTPSPTGQPIEGPNGVRVDPIEPLPSGAGGGGGTGGGGGPGASSKPTRPRDPLVVATKLAAPTGVALLPDGSALVGERRSGRIVQVQPRAGRPVPTVRTLTGLDTRGDGGLLDLAVSPTYNEDNLVYAYISTRTDNRVVDFTLDGPVTPVLTGIPHGLRDNTGRITFGGDGDLYVGTGDAGRPGQAPLRSSLAGKVLRIKQIGSAARGNPVPTSPVYTSGQRVVNGLCAVPDTAVVLEVEAGAPGQPDVVNTVEAGGFYGWPATVAGSTSEPIATLPAAFGDPGGCTVLNGRIWVTSLDGRAVISAPLRGTTVDPGLGQFVPALRNRYGRLKTVFAAPDGALWLTTSNRDGHGKPVAADERVIRYVPTQADSGGRTT